MAKKKTVSVYIRGSEQWSFEPMDVDVGENVLITPRFARMPQMSVGAELKVDKELVGTVTAHGSYKGSSMMIHYEPAPTPAIVRKPKRRAQVKVKAEKVETEDGPGSSGVGSSGITE